MADDLRTRLDRAMVGVEGPVRAVVGILADEAVRLSAQGYMNATLLAGIGRLDALLARVAENAAFDPALPVFAMCHRAESGVELEDARRRSEALAMAGEHFGCDAADPRLSAILGFMPDLSPGPPLTPSEARKAPRPLATILWIVRADEDLTLEYERRVSSPSAGR